MARAVGLNDMADREQRRLAALADYAVMDTPREASFDELATLAARLCDVPVAVVNLVGEKRQFFKAEVGLNLREMPLESSFCARALDEDDDLVVADATRDPRFARNPLVVGPPHIRFYAGVLLKTAEGLAIGTLCILDYRPRELTDLQHEALRVLARQVMAQLDLRRAMRDRERRYEAARANEARLRLVLDSARDYAIITTDVDRRITGWSAGAQASFALGEAEAIGRPIDTLFVAEDRDAGVPQREVDRVRADGSASDVRWHVRADGTRVFMNGSVHPILDGDGRLTGYLKIARDETRERDQASELARTRRDLIDSEARFRNMADHAPVMMWVTDAAGQATYLNRRWYEFTGQTVAAAEGLDWLDVTHPGDRAETERIFLDANARRAPFRMEYRLRRADGQYRWAIDAASPRFGDDGAFLGYIGSVIDIDERREAEDALRRANALLAAVMEAVPGVVYAKDRDGRLIAGNRGMADVIGKPLDRIVGLTDDEILDDPAEAAAVAANDARVMTENRTQVVEEEVSRADGTRATWLSTKSPFRDADGVVTGLVGASIDISERKRAEDALRRLNETLEEEVAERTAERDRIWATSPDLMTVIDFDGVFRHVNPAWTTLLGYAPDDLVGYHIGDFIVPEDRDAAIAASDLAARGGRPRLENRFRHRDGSFRWMSWVAAPAGGMTYATGRDVTAEKEQALALQQAEAQLRQAQKMEAVGQLTGGIAHDFNNLLTGVIGSLDLMQRRLARGETDRIAHYATMAMASANRAAALTHRLLAFSRRQPLDPRPVDANRLVLGMEELLRRSIGEAVTLDIVAAGDLWRSLCDPHQLESAILNLAINARDAMPDGGVLTIETCNAHLDDAYALRDREVRPGHYVCVCVTDTGMGMSPETIARAFEPFFTTKPIGQGTGLGLSMIYGFARQSEGYVRIYSEEGRGTTIRLYLPRHHGPADDAGDAAPVSVNAPPARSGETVLVVEDEAAVRTLVVDVLHDLGYRVVQAADGPSGLERLQSDLHIDLLVTDIGLPGLNGRQIADAARARRPDLKVLFMTGYAENATIANGFLEPGMQMITKPFAMDALVARVRATIAGDAPA